ncbi:TPA: hypothetical protein HA318_02130 [Candidatus Micrarchaeota archaeon]|nr:MAG: hypothetical protein AUJ65_06615 [Candidatus Micrarchaeota archaeon CG1_02_51_15]HII38776.1 hypothetical protein [Candidatus Micrarchaeota archaeon]
MRREQQFENLRLLDTQSERHWNDLTKAVSSAVNKAVVLVHPFFDDRRAQPDEYGDALKRLGGKIRVPLIVFEAKANVRETRQAPQDGLRRFFHYTYAQKPVDTRRRMATSVEPAWGNRFEESGCRRQVCYGGAYAKVKGSGFSSCFSS